MANSAFRTIEDELRARIAELEAENNAYRDLERKCEALEADYVISNRELLIKQVEINRQSARIAELEAERRWIPVGERLPEEKQDDAGETVDEWGKPDWVGKDVRK